MSVLSADDTPAGALIFQVKNDINMIQKCRLKITENTLCSKYNASSTITS